MSDLIDHLIKPLPNRYPSSIKEIWDLLDKLRDIKVISNAILVIVNVQIPYSNIQTNKGLEALKNVQQIWRWYAINRN